MKGKTAARVLSILTLLSLMVTIGLSSVPSRPVMAESNYLQYLGQQDHGCLQPDCRFERRELVWL